AGANGIVSEMRAFVADVQKLPAGIIAEKRADTLQVRGVTQPATFSGGATVITLDTTSVVTARPATSTVFISAHGAEFIPAGATAAQTIFWKDETDFTYKLDDVKNFLVAHEGALASGLVLGLFLVTFVSQILWACVMVVVVAAVTLVTWWLLRRTRLPVYDTAVVLVRSLVGPAVVWALLTVAGVPIAGIVETILFVVYSSIALRPILYAVGKVDKGK
ncbi:hypothetical protein HY065_01615, partial [Candidatus Berkelbacteria bacterium]|nr:hypothetical protein [Candidatus Berkelbacteria bacterium]